MSLEDRNYAEIEDQLRAQAPTLPPLLRERVLQNCRQRQQRNGRGHQHKGWRFAGALACIYVLQWVTVTALDNQRAGLLAPQSTANQTNISLMAASPDHTAQSIRNTLQFRSRTIALLMGNNEINALAPDKEASNVEPKKVFPTPSTNRSG